MQRTLLTSWHRQGVRQVSHVNYNSSGVFRLILREGEPGAFRNGTEMSSYKDIKIMS